MTTDKIGSKDLTSKQGALTAKQLEDYQSVALELLSKTGKTQSERDFLRDYIQTISQQAKVRSNSEATTSLPGGMETVASKSLTIKLNELVVKPEQFDGVYPRPRKWIQEYDEARIANGWTSFIAVKYFSTFLVGPAKDWYYTDVLPKITGNTHWNDVIQWFRENYLGEADFDKLTQAIEDMKQRPGESVSTFIPRLRRLLLMLNPEIKEKEQIRQIKSKLRPEYKAWLAYSTPSGISDLRAICLRIEAGFTRIKTSDETHAKHDGKVRNDSKKSQFTSNRAGFMKTKGPSRDKLNSSGSRMNPGKSSWEFQKKALPPAVTNNASETRCFKCDRTGHVARDCFAKTKKDGTQINQVRHESIKPANALSNEGSEEKDKVTIFKHPCKGKDIVNRIIQTRKSFLIEKMIKCNGVDINATVDTGAYVSVIDEDIVTSNGWEVTKLQHPLVGADGCRLISIGNVSLRVEMRIGNITKTKLEEATVVRNLTSPMLIGINLLSAFQVKIEVKSGQLSFDNIGDSSGMRTSRDELIPARTQKIIEVRVNTAGPVMTVPFNKDWDIAVANSITEVSDNLGTILVMNQAPEEVILKQNIEIATYEAIEDKEPNLVNAVIKLKGSEEVVTTGPDLDTKQLRELDAVLNEHRQAFSLNNEIGCTSVASHRIDLLDGATPIAEPLRRRAYSQIIETRRQVADMLQQGIIEESDSPWASAYVLARKKNGEMRLCIDFRKLNNVTKKMVYPLPNIEECLETLAGKKFFSQLDFASGFWQIPMEQKSKELTAFRTEDGLFHFTRMPFGLTNAPASFQRTINAVLSGLKGMNLQVFIDDVCIATATWPEHIMMIAKVLKLVIQANLKIKASKCVFGAKSIKFLGHEISADGIKQDPDKLRALDNLPIPEDAKGVKRIIGMFSYYRKFVPNFATIAEPLTELTRKSAKFQWNDAHNAAFKQLITELKKNITLAHFNHHDPVLVKTDASHQGVAGMLLQKQDTDWKLVSCCSRRLSSSERNYGITDLEGLAVIYTVCKFRPYLLGKPFQIVVDHCALCVLNKRTPQSARLRRWAIILSEFEFEIVYTKGKLHQDIDCLSRAPVNDAEDSYLENRILLVTPLDVADWIISYDDEESRKLYGEAKNRQNNLKLINGIIYRNELLYVPVSKRQEIVEAVHSNPQNAHPGITAMVAKLSERYWWPRMKDMVEQVLAKCEPCILQKPDRTQPAGSMYSFEIYEPAKRVAIDSFGPITESDRGNKHVIVAIDMFTRFVEAKAVPDITCPTFVRFFTEYCGRFGVPYEILTDVSNTFCGSLTRDALKVFGARHLKSTPHHSQGNAIVERVIQTVQEKLRIILGNPLASKHWDDVLSVAVLSINTTHHRSIGHSPYEMTFGRRQPLQDRDLTENTTPYDLHVKVIQNYMDECYADAVVVQSASQENSRRFYEADRCEKSYLPNELVAIKGRQRRAKLASRFNGPYRVVEANKDIYKLEDVSNNKTIMRHVSDLKPYWSCLTMITILLGLITPGLGERLFDLTSPAIWLNTKYFVELGIAEYEIYYSYKSPCSLFETYLIQDEYHSHDVIYNASNPNSIGGRVAAFTENCERLYSSEFLGPLNNLAYVSVPHRKFPYHKLVMKPNSVDLEGANIRGRKNILEIGWKEEPNEITSENVKPRGKRGIVTNVITSIAQETLTQAAGFFLGNVASNLVMTVFEYINPNSNTKILARAKESLETLTRRVTTNEDIAKSMENQLETLEQILRIQVRKLESLSREFPKFTHLAQVIGTKIVLAGRDIREITDKAELGLVATEAMSRLLNHPAIRHLRSEDSAFIGSEHVDTNTLKLIFASKIRSIDTFVYQVYAFNHWDNLTQTPVMQRYTGSKYLIYNETSDCIKGIEPPDAEEVLEECVEHHYEDPAVGTWEPDTRANFEESKQDSQVKRTMMFDYIYCFPGQITIQNKTVRCPASVFKLPSKLHWKTYNKKSLSQKYNINVTNEMAMDIVHPANFEDDMDAVNTLKLFDAIQNSSRRIAELEQQRQDSIAVSTKGSAWTGILSFVVVATISPIVYCLIVTYLKIRKANRIVNRRADLEMSTRGGGTLSPDLEILQRALLNTQLPRILSQ